MTKNKSISKIITKVVIFAISIILAVLGGYRLRDLNIKIGSENVNNQYQFGNINMIYNNQTQEYNLNVSATNTASGVVVQVNAATSDQTAVNPQLFKNFADYISKNQNAFQSVDKIEK